MATLDFLASDIVFPSDSNEPKLSVNASSKLPDPVDWSLHDYYSTALEKNFVPIHSLTDLRKLEPVPQKEAFYDMPSFTVHNSNDSKPQLSEDKVLLLLSIRKAVAAALPQQQDNKTKHVSSMLPSHPPALEDPKEIRAALRGALELTQNDMQHNGLAHPNRIARSEWKWEDEILHDALELPVARATDTSTYLIDDDIDDDESLPYCSSDEDDASSIAYSISHAPPMPPVHFDSATNTTLVSSRSSSVTAASSTRWSTVMDKIKSITKPFKSSSDKRSNSSEQQQGGLRRFLVKRRQN
ncbi:hypothetical protein BJV82DRAFT_587187 [Fennellomyces sp. T-0311]|nr:hypothetical protein BJV82DRAFT_587187 [Fennellomyces sp. T-0311]